MSTSSPRTPGARAWAIYLGALTLVGAYTLALLPRAAARSHPASSLAMLFAVASCGVMAEAVWNVRPWQYRALVGAATAAAALAVVRYADTAMAARGEPSFPPEPRVIGMVMLVSLGLLFIHVGIPVAIPRGPRSPP
jgi:hypothetical protein